MGKNVIINGLKVEGFPKSVKCPIKGKEVDLNLTYIADAEKPSSWEWLPISGNKDLMVKASKSGNKVSNEIIFKGNPIFTNLSAQSVFQVMLYAFGQPISTTDNNYKKGNPFRKESKSGSSSAKMVLTEKGTF